MLTLLDSSSTHHKGIVASIRLRPSSNNHPIPSKLSILIQHSLWRDRSPLHEADTDQARIPATIQSAWRPRLTTLAPIVKIWMQASSPTKKLPFCDSVYTVVGVVEELRDQDHLASGTRMVNVKGHRATKCGQKGREF